MLEILQKLDIIIFNHSWPIYIFRLCKIITQAYDLIEVKFGMFSCYSRCCVGMTLGSENHVRCQTSRCTLVHSRSTSLIRLQGIMQTCTSLNASYTGMIWPYSVHCKISSSCFPDNMTVKRKAQNDVRLERHQSNA